MVMLSETIPIPQHLGETAFPSMCTQTSPFPHPTPVYTPKRRQRIHHRHPTSVNTLISTSALLGCQEHNDTPQLNSSWWWIHQPQGSGQELEKWSVPRVTAADSTHFPEWMLVLCRKLCLLLLDTRGVQHPPVLSFTDACPNLVGTLLQALSRPA